MQLKQETEKKKKNPLVTLVKTEWANLHERKTLFFIYLSFFVLNGIIRLIEPVVIGIIFNTIQNEIKTQSELYHLIFLISLILGIELLSWMFHGTARIMEQRTGFHVAKNFTNKKIEKVLELPVEWHKDNHTGDTLDRMNKGNETMSEFSSHMTFQIVGTFMSLFGSAIALLFFDVTAAIVSLLFSALVLFLITRFDKKLLVLYRERNKLENAASASILDYMSNVITVITLRLKKTVKKEIDSKISAPYPVYKRSASISETKWAFASISIKVMIVFLLSWRAYSDFHGSGVIMIGTLYILFSYLERMGNTFFSLAWMYGDIVRMGSKIDNVQPIEDEYNKIKSRLTDNLPYGWKHIDIKNLYFTYNKEGKQRHLNNINFSFRRGEKIALVGESGSGKSTLLAILRGLYEPQEANVYVDGKHINNGIHNIGEHVTLIPQDPEIFNNTIKFNVAMGLSYKKEDIEQAIAMAQFSKVVSRLTKGLDTSVLEKGVSLSGGEKQRLALARGLLAARASDIVLLDEPTSSVDSANEVKIHDNIFKAFKDKTIISSIHRLHLLEKFDTIYLFSQGTLVAKGSFSEMMKVPDFASLLRKYKGKERKG